MHRYFLFFGECYYPCGGFEDFKYSSDSISGCKKYFKKQKLKNDDVWAHIVDIFDGRIILEWHKKEEVIKEALIEYIETCVEGQPLRKVRIPIVKEKAVKKIFYDWESIKK